jgi:hypothetical protein
VNNLIIIEEFVVAACSFGTTDIRSLVNSSENTTCPYGGLLQMFIAHRVSGQWKCTEGRPRTKTNGIREAAIEEFIKDF